MPLFSNPILQGMVSGVQNNLVEYVAGRAIPAIASRKSGIFVTRDRLAAITTDVDLSVASCAQAVQLPHVASVGTAYSTDPKAAKKILCFDEMYIDESNTETGMVYMEDLVETLLAYRESRMAAVITNSTWNTASVANVGGADVWATTGDPWAQIFSASQAIPGGANTVIMGANAWRLFLSNPKAVAYLADDTFKFITPEQATSYMRDSLGIPTLYVASARTSAGYIFPQNDVFVARIEGNGGETPQGTLVRPTALARFVASDLLGLAGGDDILVKSEEVFDAGVRGGEMWRAATDEVIVQVSPELGVRLGSVQA